MRFRIGSLILGCFVLVASFPVMGQGGDSQSQIRLVDYLADLRAQGVRIIYSSDLVSDSLMVDLPEDPDGDVAAALVSLLEPLELAVENGPQGSLLIVPLKTRTPGAVTPRPVPKPPMPEIVVTSSLHRIEYTAVGTHTIVDKELAGRIPVTGDDVVRLTHRLPGTATGGISSKSHVRGGEEDEVLFLFEGLRLYEPYHLRDFQSVATIINSRAVDSIDFYTGAYPAHYGDRMSGVLAMEMRRPDADRETELSVSFFNTSVLSLGRFGGAEEGDWLFSARRGNLDLIADVVDPDTGSPDYQDYIGHIGWDFGRRAQLAANVLVSDDKIRLADIKRGEQATARYANRVGWVKWDAAWTDALRSSAIFAASEIKNRRSGTLNLPGIVTGQLNDELDLNVYEFRQDWSWAPAERWMLSFGANLKHLDAHYRHLSDKSIDPRFVGISGSVEQRSLDSNVAVDGAQYALYSEFRWRIAESVFVDAGLRWDQQTYTVASNDRQISPRASILLQPSDRTEVRFGWGQYYQAQETNELQIGDGIDTYFPAQRAEHFVANVRHAFSARTTLDVSLFRKSFRTLRPRFENIFNNLTLIPELQFDRIMINPDKAESLGAEATLTHGSSSDAVFWWLSYAWAETRDWTASGKIPRSWDQTHALEGGISRKAGPWSMSATADIHTGWPKTKLIPEYTDNPDGSRSLRVVATPRNSERYATYASIDVRVSRDFDVERGDLTAFLSISNALNRSNPCCLEYSVDAEGTLQSRTARWLPLVPSLGVIWRF